MRLQTMLTLIAAATALGAQTFDPAMPAPVPAQAGPMSAADRVIDKYRRIGDAQKHVYRDRGTGAPDYNINLNAKSPEAAKPAAPAAPKPPNP